MRMRRMEDGYMHRRMQKNKHMQGNDLDTPTDSSSRMFIKPSIGAHVVSGLYDKNFFRKTRNATSVHTRRNLPVQILIESRSPFPSPTFSAYSFPSTQRAAFDT